MLHAQWHGGRAALLARHQQAELLHQTPQSLTGRPRTRQRARPPRRAARAQLPEELLAARRLQRTGLRASAATLAAAGALVPTLGLQPPALPDWALPAAAALLGGPPLLLAAAKLALGERLGLELHDGRLYIQWDVPQPSGVRLPPGAIEVRPAGAKGNGAFATQPIPRATYLGDYEGELLDEAAYWERYPDGVADYCMGIDRQWSIDARQRARDTSAFSPCHMNHSGRAPNVQRICKRAEKRILFFAARDIQEGEELLLDYGKLYWTGREDQMID